MRGLAQCVEQRTSLTTLAAGELEALFGYDRMPRQDGVAKFQPVAVVARDPVREMIAEAVGDLGQLIVLDSQRSVGRVVWTEAKHLLQPHDLRLESLELA